MDLDGIKKFLSGEVIIIEACKSFDDKAKAERWLYEWIQNGGIVNNIIDKKGCVTIKVTTYVEV